MEGVISGIGGTKMEDDYERQQRKREDAKQDERRQENLKRELQQGEDRARALGQNIRGFAARGNIAAIYAALGIPYPPKNILEETERRAESERTAKMLDALPSSDAGSMLAEIFNIQLRFNDRAGAIELWGAICNKFDAYSEDHKTKIFVAIKETMGKDRLEQWVRMMTKQSG